MKNTIDTTSRIEAPTRRIMLGNSPLLARLSKVAALSALTIIAACSDNNGRYTPGNQADAGIASDSGITGTDSSGADAGSTADTSTADAGTVDSTVAGTDASSTVDTSTDGGSTSSDTSTADAGVDSTIAGTDASVTADTLGAADTDATADASISQDTTSPVDTSKPSTPDIAPTPVKVAKPAPADEWMSGYKPGMELPVEQVFITNKPYTAVVGYGYKDQIKPLTTDFAATVNGADVYKMKVGDLPKNESDAGTKNFRVVTTNNPPNSKIGTYVTTLTGKKAQDGVTPLYDQGAILPVLCDDGEYYPEDAALLTEAMTMTGKMEFNHNLEEMRDTYISKLQDNVNAVFFAAGKVYAPQCEVQVVTSGKPGIIDAQACPVGCLVSYVTVQPIASWTEKIQSGN